MSDDVPSILRRLVTGCDMREPDQVALVGCGFVSHSVNPEWTKAGLAALDEIRAEFREEAERRNRAVRYVVISMRSRAIHLNYHAAIDDFRERCGRLQRARIELRRGGSMELVADWKHGAERWFNGWPERADKDTRKNEGVAP